MKTIHSVSSALAVMIIIIDSHRLKQVNTDPKKQNKMTQHKHNLLSILYLIIHFMHLPSKQIYLISYMLK